MADSQASVGVGACRPSSRIRLLARVRGAVRARHYSRRTEQAYVRWIKEFVRYHGLRHPGEMGEAEIAAFLTHLAVRRQVSAGTQNQAASVLLFLYREVLRRPLRRVGDVLRARQPRRVPVVLTQAEVRRVLGELRGINRLVVQLLYGSGLRLLEALRLRVKDVDFGRGEIVVRDGKGARDRVTMLPRAFVAPLKAQLERVARISGG